MPNPAPHLADLLAQAEKIAATGPISHVGRWTYRGAILAVADLPPAARRAAVWSALGQLAESDPAVGLHALAAAIRAATDAAIEARAPSVLAGRNDGGGRGRG